MGSPAKHSAALTRDGIALWIKEYLHRSLALPPGSVDDDAYFSDYGVDSMFAVVMTGDMRLWTKADIGPTALYEFPTVNQLADHVAKLAGLPPGSSDSPSAAG